MDDVPSSLSIYLCASNSLTCFFLRINFSTLFKNYFPAWEMQKFQGELNLYPLECSF